MQMVKIAVIDKRTPDFKVRVEDTFMSIESVWNYFHSDDSSEFNKDFVSAAKVIVGLPASAPADVFVYAEHLINPDTGEVVEFEHLSIDDFMTMVYQRRTELISEQKKIKKELDELGVAYRMVFNLLDFLQDM